MSDKKTNEDVWTRDQAFGGVGEAYDPEAVEVEEGAADCFCGFEADIEVDVEQQLDDEFERMDRGDSE